MKFSDPFSNIVQMNVLPGMQVADFGSGVGFYSLALAQEVGKQGTVYAIDIQTDHLSKLKREAHHRGYDNIETIHGDLERIGGSGLIQGTIDRIVISNVLFQVDDPSIVAKEALRILKPSGCVAVIDWMESYNQIGPHPDRIILPTQVIQIFESVGFKMVSRLDSGAHHYGYLFKRASIQ